MLDPLSYEGLIASDSKLLAKPLNPERYRKLASAVTIEKTRAALAEKKFSVEVVQTKEEVKNIYETKLHGLTSHLINCRLRGRMRTLACGSI